MKYCRVCKTSSDDINNYCPKCGAELTAETTNLKTSSVGYKNSSPFFKIFLVIIAIGIVIYLFRDNFKIVDNKYSVILEVLGDNGALISYTNNDGGIEQITTQELPWYQEYECSGETIFSLTAQAQNYDSIIEVNIKVNGVIIKTAKSKGDFAVASTVAAIK